MAKESAMVKIETKITCVCDSSRLMAIVGFQLCLLCADAICAIRLCCSCPGKAKLGEDHPETLQSLNNLAALLEAQGQLAEAESRFREALKKSPGAQPQGFQKGLWAVYLGSHLIGLSLGNLVSHDRNRRSNILRMFLAFFLDQKFLKLPSFQSMSWQTP